MGLVYSTVRYGHLNGRSTVLHKLKPKSKQICKEQKKANQNKKNNLRKQNSFEVDSFGSVFIELDKSFSFVERFELKFLILAIEICELDVGVELADVVIGYFE